MTSDELFWLDPWSAQGQAVAPKLLPSAHDLRAHAEQAIVLLAQMRAATIPSSASPMRSPPWIWARAASILSASSFSLRRRFPLHTRRRSRSSTTRRKALPPTTLLSEISGDNGRCQDLRDAYSALKSEYSQVWLSENRPYWLNNVTVRYDLEIERWQRRGDQFAAAICDWQNGQDLPAAAALGLPAPAASAH